MHSAISVANAMPSATSVARPRSRSGGFTRKPTTLIKGSTSHPVRRSSTTEANVLGVSPVSRDSLATRSTSPPIVVGRTLETN